MLGKLFATTLLVAAALADECTDASLTCTSVETCDTSSGTPTCAPISCVDDTGCVSTSNYCAGSPDLVCTLCDNATGQCASGYSCDLSTG